MFIFVFIFPTQGLWSWLHYSTFIQRGSQCLFVINKAMYNVYKKCCFFLSALETRGSNACPCNYRKHLHGGELWRASVKHRHPHPSGWWHHWRPWCLFILFLTCSTTRETPLLSLKSTSCQMHLKERSCPLIVALPSRWLTTCFLSSLLHILPEPPLSLTKILPCKCHSFKHRITSCLVFVMICMVFIESLSIVVEKSFVKKKKKREIYLSAFCIVSLKTCIFVNYIFIIKLYI